MKKISHKLFEGLRIQLFSRAFVGKSLGFWSFFLNSCLISTKLLKEFEVNDTHMHNVDLFGCCAKWWDASKERLLKLVVFCYICSKHVAYSALLNVSHGSLMSNDASMVVIRYIGEFSSCLTTIIMDYCIQRCSTTIGGRPVCGLSFKSKFPCLKCENRIRAVLSAIKLEWTPFYQHDTP